MTQKKRTSKKKRISIPLRRKIVVTYHRVMFFIKIALVIFTSLFLFTNYFDGIKQEILQNIYESTSDIGFRLENVLIEGQYNSKEEDILTTLNADYYY